MHVLAFPGCNSTIVNALFAIWKHQFFINTKCHAVAFAALAGAKWVVKCKEMDIGLLKALTIEFKALVEMLISFGFAIK